MVRTPEARMAALSFLVLYLELALIRWVSGYVHNFGYFTNFAMLAAFLGIGLGCLLARRPSLLAWLPWALVALGTIVRLLNVQIDLPSASPAAAFWSEALQAELKLPVTSGVTLYFVLITAIFVAPGQLMGALFEALPRLRAYGLNVLGGLMGILAFALDSRLQHSPTVWFSVSVAALAPFLAATPRRSWPLHGAALATFPGIVYWHTTYELWSPYYRQTLLKTPDGFVLTGNGVLGISIADFDHLTDTKMYEVPYGAPVRRLRRRPDAPIRRALIIGCGAGNDVAMALRNGVEHVDAVDINPWVVAMGKKHHPLQPFASDRVTTIVADGRQFLAHSEDRYDLIVYGLPDSTFSNDRANLRVESFIFTTEAFEKVFSRLSENGFFVLYNYYRVPWLRQKVEGMLRSVSGQEPYVKLFVDDSSITHLPAAMAAGPGLDLPPALDQPAPPPATDDWPFLYIARPSIPDAYVKAVGAAVAVSLLLVLGTIRWTRDDDPGEPERPLVLAALFFLGLAFVLLEARSVVTFGLFFGSTWWNNVVVFASVHVSVLLAVLASTYFPAIPRWAMAAALLGSLGFAWGLPPATLLIGATWTRAVLAGTVAFVPIFFANVLFASIFRSTRQGRVSYAFNLLGGMLGGMLEYVSLLIGHAALIGLATVFYLMALLFAYRHSTRDPERTELA